MRKIAITAHVGGSVVGTCFPSIRSCAKQLGLQSSHVCEVLSGKRKQHKGYTFKPVYCDYNERRKANGKI